MAGPLFENFCVQETLKLFFNRGEQPRVYYLRTNNNLEVDIIIEKTFQSVIPVEIKLNKTPNLSMASNITRFRKIFSDLDISTGLLVSLADKSFWLSREINAVSLDDYLRTL